MAQSQAVPCNYTRKEPCNIMHTLERMYQKNITHAFKMSFYSNETDIAVAVEGHTVGLHNLQTGRNKKMYKDIF